MSFNPYDLLNNQHIGLVYPLDTSGCKNVLLIDNEVKDAQLFIVHTITAFLCRISPFPDPSIKQGCVCIRLTELRRF